MSWTRKYKKGLEELEHLLLKCLPVPQRSSVVVTSDYESTPKLYSRANILF